MASELSVQRYLTPQIEDQVFEVARRGGIPEEMALRKVDWFHAYLRTADATQSAIECGLGGKTPSWKGNSLVKQFYPLIQEAGMIKRAAIEPLALKVLEDAMRVDHMVPLILRDGDGNQLVTETLVPDAKILAVKVKAADSVLDRGLMPKGLALHGLGTGMGGDGDKPSDWKAHLDELVVRLGVDVVMGLPLVRQRQDLRAYLEERYPVKVVNEVQSTEVSNDDHGTGGGAGEIGQTDG